MTATGGGVSPIGVRNIRALRTAFRRSGTKEFDRHITKVHRDIADKVVRAAKPKISTVSSDTASATEAATSATAAKIRVSLADAPQAGGVIFGAIRTKRRILPSGKAIIGWKQFRQFVEGEPYHIYPELDAMRDEIADGYLEAVDDFLTEQGVPK